MAEHTCRTETASGSRSLDALGCEACADARHERKRRLSGLAQRVYLESARTWSDVFVENEHSQTLEWATSERDERRGGRLFVSWHDRDGAHGGGWVRPTDDAAAEMRRHLREPGGFKAIQWGDGRVLVVASNRDHIGDIWLAMLESAAGVPRDVLTRSSMTDIHKVGEADRKARGERRL